MAVQYTVRKGDTLSAIASAQGVKLGDISGYRSGNPDLIRPGEVLSINKAAPPAPGSQTQPPPTTTPPPTNTPPPSTPSTPPDAGRFLRYTPAYSTEEKDLFNTTVSGIGQAPDKASILEEKRRAAEAAASVIRESFNRVIRQEREAGDRRNARTRALNIGSGLGGSDFGSANAQETEDANLKIIQERERERDAAISNLYAQVEERASSEFQSQREKYLERAEKGLGNIQKFREKQKGNVTSAIQAFAGQGYTLDQVKKENSTVYNQLLQDAADGGLSQAEVEYMFVQNKPKETRIGDTTVGNKKVFFFQDPLDPKKITTQEVNLPDFNGDSEDVIEDAYGNPMIITYEGEKGKSKITGTRPLAGVERKTAAGTEKDTGFKFTNDDRGKLINANFSDKDIDNIQKDIREYGADKALEGLPENQQKVARSILGGAKAGSEPFISTDYFKTLFKNSSTDDKLKALGKKRTDYASFWSSAKTEEKGIDDDFNKYIEGLMPVVEQYRKAGYTDKEILEKMQ